MFLTIAALIAAPHLKHEQNSHAYLYDARETGKSELGLSGKAGPSYLRYFTGDNVVATKTIVTNGPEGTSTQHI